MPDAAGVYVHVVRGRVAIGGEELAAGDSARITESRGLEAEALEDAEALVWELAAV